MPMALSTTMSMGAIAMIGIVLLAMTQGIIDLSMARFVHDADRERDAEHGAEPEAEQRRRKRDPRVVDERALRSDAHRGRGIPDFGDDLVGRGRSGLSIA